MLNVVLLLVIAAATVAAPQSPRFEVASIRSKGTPGAPPLVSVLAGGRLTAPNSTLRDLIRAAYNVDDNRVLGGPEWMSVERFAIEAKAEAADPTNEQMQALLAALLADRFKLQVHRETRELPVYALTLTRADRRLGPNLRPSGSDCRPITPPPGYPPPPPPPPADSLRRPLVPANIGMRCPAIFFPGWIAARAVTFEQFVPRLALAAGRPVVDRTGLSGEFDVDLRYTPEQPPMLNGATLPPAADGESLFTAIKEQLGLALDGDRAPFEVLVVDRAERPTDN